MSNAANLPSLSICSRDFRPANFARYMAPIRDHHHVVSNHHTGEELFSSLCFFAAQEWALSWEPSPVDRLNAIQLDL